MTTEAEPDTAKPNPEGAASTSPETAPSAESPAAHEPEAAVEMPFQAEVQRVLALVIDSLYTHKEVFLRELVSNASDALDKARFYQLTHDDATKQVGEPAIRITADEDARTLTIEDNGIGMTREEVIANLGTIAKSGSREFLKQHGDDAKSKDAALNLIGQFGVGFYAAFMVATRVDVRTLSMKAGAKSVIWRSSGAGTFTVTEGERTTPGTEIVLHLKEDQRDFTRAWRLKDVVTKYSDYVSVPIYIGGEVANQSKALWTLPRSQVTPEQHAAFFKHVTGGTCGDAPLLTIHISVDAPVQFQALLYVPEKAPFDLFQKERTALKLYAKRVLIVESCDKLTPLYLRFLRGVVDSEDLSLNVSREMLQESRTLTQIETMIVRQVLKALKDLAESDADKYKTFWKLFGKVLKEGITLAFQNKEPIAELCRFESLTTKEGDFISFGDYVKAMPDEQREIFFITGSSRKALISSPHLEGFKKKGYDVLFLTDPIDEWMVEALGEFDKRKLKSVVHGDIDLGETAETGDDADAALRAIQKTLGDRVKEVRFSKRLTDSASCLVSADGDPGANMERIMKLIDERALEKKRILEVNPTHPIVRDIGRLAAKEETSERVQAYCETLYDQALLAEGVAEDPAKLVRRIQDLLGQAAAAAAGANG